jgi:hypothetical protein
MRMRIFITKMFKDPHRIDTFYNQPIGLPSNLHSQLPLSNGSNHRKKSRRRIRE